VAQISDNSLKRAGIKPIGDWQVNPEETAYLNSLFANAQTATDAIAPGPDASAQRRAIDNLLRGELEHFVATNANSAYAPGLHVLLGDKARMRSGYSLAMEHYEAAFNGLIGSPDPTAFAIAHEASGALAKLLALTGQIDDLDGLEGLAEQMGPGGASGYDWGWAKEMRGWVVRHPEETYKCGLYCLDQLGRLTQPGQFLPKNVLEIASSTNGFTAADLVRLGTSAGLRVHAAVLASTNGLPVPSILHLKCEHFIFLREQRGAFFNVLDPVAYGPKWVTLDDLLEEMTGCVVVSDAVPSSPGVSLVAIDAATAAGYRGRCHVPIPADHDNSPPCTTCPCPPGTSANAAAGHRSGGAGGAGGLPSSHGAAKGSSRAIR
jgi:hypothetical protein